MSVNNKIYSSNLMTPLTKTLYAFGESLESPQKNYLDFQQKILKNPRMLKKIDFDNNELVNNHNNHIKNENQSEDYKLKIRPQFFNFKKNENKNLRNISNFNDEGLVQEKNGNASEKKNNLTPEFKK